MDSKEKALLIALMNQEHLSGTELASVIQMSTRSVRTLIKKINEKIEGALIESGSFGYKLIVNDPSLFLEYLQDNKENQEETQNRFLYLFNQFIFNDDYLKIDDLCEELYLSRTQLKQELKKLRHYFLQYDLKIETKTHYGLKLDNDELNIRRAICHFKDYPINEEIYKKIKKIISSCLVNYEFELSDENLENITFILYVIYLRKGYPISFKEDLLEEIKKEKEYMIASSIMTVMKSILEMNEDENEIAYLTIHLCGKNNKQKSSQCIDQSTYDLVQLFLKKIEDESQATFTTDLNLQISLSLHIMSLIKRIHYQTYMTNPMLQEVKTKLLVAYELAIKGCEVINSQYHCILPEDEIAYFALYIHLSLQQSTNDLYKKNILVVCSSGIGSAKLLEHYFKTNFSEYIAHIEMSSLQELKNHDFRNYDCIFTTVPINMETNIPIFKINNLMSKDDTLKISKQFESMNQTSLSQYFPKDLFFNYDTFQSKEEAIHEIVEKCHQHYDLPKEFEQFVLEREKLSTTEFNDLIAFPHSHQPISNETFVSVTVLKKPLQWKNHKIRIILLFSVEKNKVKNLDSFYATISALISNKTLLWQLIQNPTYEEFIHILKKVQS